MIIQASREGGEKRRGGIDNVGVDRAKRMAHGSVIGERARGRNVKHGREGREGEVQKREERAGPPRGVWAESSSERLLAEGPYTLLPL